MSKKVLILTGAYYPKPSANGICCKNIVDAAADKGCEFFCVANREKGMPAREDIDSVHVFRVSMPVDHRLRANSKETTSRARKKLFAIFLKIVSIANAVLAAFEYPIRYRCHAKRMYKAAKEIIKDNDIDVVFCITAPLCAVYAGYRLKCKYPDIKLVTYCLDPVFGIPKTRLLTAHQANKRIDRIEKKLLKASDAFIVQKEHRRHYESKFNKDQAKIHYVGVPLLVDRKITEGTKTKEQKKTVLFAGSLDADFRNPQYIIEAFRYVKKAKLDMYISAGRPLAERLANDNVQVHGRVPHEEALRLMENADALLNIGNSMKTSSPSKIVEYMSFCKPLISTYRIDGDTCNKYMKMYPLGLYLDERSLPPELAAQEIDAFLEKDGQVEYDELISVFPEDSPQAVIDIVAHLFETN